MSLFRRPFFFSAYRFFPHTFLNRCARYLMQAQRPQWLIQRLIRLWIKRAAVPMQEFEETTYSSIEDFFLRRIKPEARPFHEGFLSPVDGILLAHGTIEADTILQVKGSPISIGQMVNGSQYDETLQEYAGGVYYTIFLTPNGYHRIHLPYDATLERVLWLPGRFFPQNPDAIHHIPRIYERNERATLCCRTPQGIPFLMTLVGASLIGSIHLTDHATAQWRHAKPYLPQQARKKGDEIAHFSFGSTVVLLLPRAFQEALPTEKITQALPIGQPLLMGQTLFACDDPRDATNSETRCGVKPHTPTETHKSIQNSLAIVPKATI